MKKDKTESKIISMMIYRSKSKPKLGHVVATLFPCGHKKYLGRAIFPKNAELNAEPLYEVTVYKPRSYRVVEVETCRKCPVVDYWLDDILEPSSLGDDFTLVDNGVDI